MIRALVRRSRAMYPHSRNYRKQWFWSTLRLRLEGKHILFGGPANWGNRRPT